jgi:hypothetical protein
MSIDAQPGGKPLVAPPPLTWGEVAPPGELAAVVRFVLEDRTVSFPVAQLRRWESVPGDREALTISIGTELVLVEGQELAAIRAALDLGRLCEVRLNYPAKTGARPGPRVRRITIEPA